MSILDGIGSEIEMIGDDAVILKIWNSRMSMIFLRKVHVGNHLD